MIMLFNLTPWIVLFLLLLVPILDLKKYGKSKWSISRVVKIILKLWIVGFLSMMILFSILWTAG
jgi:hypothetical protein